MTAIPSQLIGDSPAFHSLLDRVSALASFDKPVLIEGERGSGKTLLAPRLHFLSPRWEQAFIAVDCAGYDAAEQTEILFGPDNLTDISGGAAGRADGGTLFLDNIDYLSPELQARLAPLLDFGALNVPGRGSREMDIRILAARRGGNVPADKNRHGLSSFLAESLGFDHIRIPPLRGRAQDIDALTRHFGRKVTASLGVPAFPGFSAELQTRFEAYGWPGNVRQLKTSVERAVMHAFLADSMLAAPIEAAELFSQKLEARIGDDEQAGEAAAGLTGEDLAAGQRANAPRGFSSRVFAFERRLIDEALMSAGNHQGRAASHLDLTYHQFRGLLRKHGLKK